MKVILPSDKKYILLDKIQFRMKIDNNVQSLAALT